MVGLAAIFRKIGVSPFSAKAANQGFFLNVKLENFKLHIIIFILKSHIRISRSSAYPQFSQ